jgi:hypothetical protein
MSDPAFALQDAMRTRLLMHAPLTALLGGAHVFDELPRGERAPHVAFAQIETRDWSVKDQKAHEHFVTIEVKSNSRSRKAAQEIVSEVEAALDNAALVLAGQTLINLRLIFWSVARAKATDTFNGVMRFRAATEPQ